jgi:hypothetical protein
MDDKRNKGLYIKFTQEELDEIQDRMMDCNIKNRSGYIRKMALGGLIVNLNLPPIYEISRLLSITSNNVNQIAKVAHSTGNIYLEDVQDVTSKLEQIRLQFGELLEELTQLNTSVKQFRR